MRAGCFAEKRVIDLLNRRFVPFFFNRGGPGKGKDEAARKFTVGKTKNQYAYLAAFTPGGQYLGETGIYADKDEVFAWLQKLLKKYPKYGTTPSYEQSVLDAAKKKETEPDFVYSAAEIHETLGQYDDAVTAYTKIVADKRSTKQLREWSHRALLRIHRYRKAWDDHASLEAAARKLDLDLGADLDIEHGRRLLGKKDYKAARARLEQACRKHPGSSRVAEAHFYTGVACWFLKDDKWAKFHWCWVVKNLPDDRLYMRAYIAAATDSMPYPNAELGGYKADCGMIGTHHIVAEVRRQMKAYRKLLPTWQKGATSAER